MTHMNALWMPVRAGLLAMLVGVLGLTGAMAQSGRANDAYRPPSDGYGEPRNAPPMVQREYEQPSNQQANTYDRGRDEVYRPNSPPADDRYQDRGDQGRGSQPYPEPQGRGGYGQPYSAAPPPVQEERYSRGGGSDERPTRGYYEQGEIASKGRSFFGSISQGLASAIEYTFQKAGRPNGYILGEDGGGAFFAGLRYGEGKLFTKDAGDHKVFWQGPSIGYDVGGEGSKTMVLVYNMSDPSDIYRRFGGVEGSAYVVGGVSVQFQKHDDVTLAVIRSGVGLRLGANVGYLKYTRSPTWNPF
jgi:hypothetical protein